MSRPASRLAKAIETNGGAGSTDHDGGVTAGSAGEPTTDHRGARTTERACELTTNSAGALTTDRTGKLGHSADDFDAMFTDDDDPWAFRSRWYEQRKRALTAACLPAPRYASAYEPGCANGELSAALAPRCGRLLATDGSARAVEIARHRCSAFGNVEVRTAWLPDDWPDGSFDLVVVSELAYYLDPPTLDHFGQRLRASLRPGATVLACHWRRPIEGCAMNGDEVHERLAQSLGLPHLLRVLDADLRLDVWCDDGRSVGEREGLAG